ncbi:hypothetical protein ES705_43954 [subsurface metagenome]
MLFYSKQVKRSQIHTIEESACFLEKAGIFILPSISCSTTTIFCVTGSEMIRYKSAYDTPIHQSFRNNLYPNPVFVCTREGTRGFTFHPALWADREPGYDHPIASSIGLSPVRNGDNDTSLWWPIGGEIYFLSSRRMCSVPACLK